MKFALLLCVLIAMFAVSNAAWTITTTDASVTQGTQTKLAMKTDAAVEIGEAYLVNFPSGGLTTLLVDGNGNGHVWCEDKAYYTVSTAESKLSVNVVKKLDAEAVVTCPIAFHPTAPASVELSISDSKVKFTVAASIESPLDTCRVSGGHSATFMCKNLPKGSIVGPFWLAMGPASLDKDTALVVTDTIFKYQVANSGFKNIGEGVRVIYNGANQFWIATDANGTEGDFSFKFPSAQVLSKKDNKDKVVFLGYFYGADKKFSQSVGGDKIEYSVTSTATAYFAKTADGTIGGYSFSFTTDVADAVVDMKISDYTNDEVWATGYTLGYSVDGKYTAITNTDKKVSFPLTGVAAGASVSFSGSFPNGTFKAFTASFSSGSSSADATAVAVANLKDKSAKITATSATEMTFTFDVEVNEIYKDASVDANLDLSIAYGETEVRALNEYTPSCTATGASLSADSGFGKSVDADRAIVNFKASMTSKAAITVTCVQKLNGGKKFSPNASLSIIDVGGRISLSATKDAAWDAIAWVEGAVTVDGTTTTNFDMVVAVTGPAVTGQTDLETIITKVKETYKDFVDGDVFHLKESRLGYSSRANGATALFENNVTFVDAAGSTLSFAYKKKVPVDVKVAAADGFAAAATDKVVVAGYVMVPRQAAATELAFPTKAAYVDGSVAAFSDAQLQLGAGAKCWSTVQCGQGLYCFQNTCVTWAELTVDAQQYVAPSAGGSSSASVVSVFFAAIVVVVALMF